MLEPLKFVAVFEAVMIAGAGGFSERNFVREGGLAGCFAAVPGQP